MNARFTALIGVAALAAGVAAEKPAAAPDVFRKLVDCRAIGSAEQRLACYDENVAALDSAQKKKDIVVVSKAEVKEARRSLFGFALPNVNIFGTGEKADKSDDLEELETTLVGFGQTRNGDWSLTLEKGGTWETRGELDFPPRRGDKVVIHKATLGSFLGRIGPNKGVRMRRVG